MQSNAHNEAVVGSNTNMMLLMWHHLLLKEEVKEKLSWFGYINLRENKDKNPRINYPLVQTSRNSWGDKIGEIPVPPFFPNFLRNPTRPDKKGEKKRRRRGEG